jgi:hypothetical protein
VSLFGDSGRGPKPIRAATLEKLVAVLTDPETPEGAPFFSSIYKFIYFKINFSYLFDKY